MPVIVSTKCTMTRAEQRARRAEPLLRAHLEPARQQEQRHERPGEHEGAPRVEQHERDGDEHHVQHAADETVDALVEQLADRLEVAGLARDDASRRVALVELQAQPLRVQVDPLAQFEQHGLADPRRQQRVLRDQHGAGDAREQVGGDRRRSPAGRRPRVSAGRPWSMPIAISAGPATCSAVLTTTTTRASTSLPRSGRSSERSRRDRPLAHRAALGARVVVALFSFDSGDAHAFTSSVSVWRSSSSDEITNR